jgi:hypothetical protein
MAAKVEPFAVLRASIPRAALGQYCHHVPVKYSPITTFLLAACNAGAVARKANNTASSNRDRIPASSSLCSYREFVCFNYGGMRQIRSKRCNPSSENPKKSGTSDAGIKFV